MKVPLNKAVHYFNRDSLNEPFMLFQGKNFDILPFTLIARALIESASVIGVFTLTRDINTLIPLRRRGVSLILFIDNPIVLKFPDWSTARSNFP